MSNPNITGQNDPWQSQSDERGGQQPYPTQPINTSKEQNGGSHAASMPLGQQFDQRQYQAQQMPQQQNHAVMPYTQPQQQMMQHGMPQNGMMQNYGALNRGPLGKVRNTWGCIGLCIITLGFYSWFWTYSVFDEMKNHRGTGTGGGIALLIEIIFSPATFFMAPSEVSHLYTGVGRPSPVSGATGLWLFLPIFGPFIWFFQVNGALNDYWTSMGAGRDQIAPQHPANA